MIKWLDYKFKKQSSAKIDKLNPIYGKSIVMTGSRDKTLKDMLISKGAKVASSVSKNTFMVLVESEDTDTGKTDTAKKLNVPILSFDKFKNKYM